MASNTIRIQLATIEGAQMPLPYGGKQRSVMVDLNLPALQAKGLSPIDVVNAVSAQNLIAPSGTVKIDRFEYAVETNSQPQIVTDLNNLPIKSINGGHGLRSRRCPCARRQYPAKPTSSASTATVRF